MTPAQIAARLPAPDTLYRVAQAAAALDAVLSPDWENRYFSFDPTWDEGEEYASMRNGSGDSYHVIFSDDGVVIRGFDHESPLSPWGAGDGEVDPGILAGFPPALQAVIDEPAFNASNDGADGAPAELTFCFWWLESGAGPGAEEPGWRCGTVTDDGGAAALMAVLIEATPTAYRAFAEDQYDVILGDEIEHLYRLDPVDADLIARLNPDADIGDVLAELDDLGIPLA